MRSAARLAERRLRLKAFSSVMDFFGVVACALLIVGFIALLVSLYAWLRTDLTESFAALRKSVTDALLVVK